VFGERVCPLWVGQRPATTWFEVRVVEDESQLSLEALESELSYFELQAYIGTTKHMGGFEATKALIELCHINKATYVLDAGCGVGATACYLAKRYGCRVVGVDLSEGMIARSNERAKRESVEDSVEFRVADVRNLPFDDALFDAILCESVATFLEDKRQVASEFVRVTKPGGYVGLNEEIWLKTPPTELIEFAKRTWEIKAQVPTADGWVGLLEGAGLYDIVVQAYKFDARRESTQVQRYRFQDMWRMFYRTLFLYIKNPAFRRYMAERRYLPKGLFEYLGYALFVGRR
jgi:arsenite methyltransferase